ncbi:ISKra4 family transposase [Streptoverticillium reticulum]|uniref:ISKra4 family transposase n=1 Tax=Streptoverticillium reticulum TaxID=1433415 RepID=UPI0039BEE88C
MERYDAPPSADDFEAATKLFEVLVTDLAAPQTGELAHHELEELLEERGRDLLRQLLQDHLDLRERREREAAATRRPHVLGPDGLPRPRLETGHGRLLATVFGTVTVSRCAWRRLDASNVHPADAVLSLPRGRHSHGLARLAVQAATRMSYDAAHEAIVRRCGRVLGKRRLAGLLVEAACDIDSFYGAKVFEPCTDSTVLVLSADGKGIVMRPEALREVTRQAAAKRQHTFRTRLAAGEKSARKRMATLGAVYDAEPAPRRPHDVITPPGGFADGHIRRPGPVARNKWLSGSVEHDAEHVVAQVFDHAHARDPGHRRPWVVLVDGARHQLDLIQAEARLHHIDVHIVIDIIHVLEKLWSAAWCFHRPGDQSAEDWVATHALAILNGDAAEVADTLQAQADQAELTSDQRLGVDTCVRYLRGNNDFLHYDQALAAGWPIATGIIEGAARHLIADRLDIGGARWGLAGAEAVLNLRAVTANGDLDAYWRHHITAEHRRLYPTDQAQYQLTA